MPFDTHHYKHRISFWSNVASLSVVLVFMGGIGGLRVLQAVDPPIVLPQHKAMALQTAMPKTHPTTRYAPTQGDYGTANYPTREDELSREVIEHQIEIRQLVEEHRQDIQTMKETNDKLQAMSDEHAAMKGFAAAGGALLAGLQILSMFFQLRRRMSER